MSPTTVAPALCARARNNKNPNQRDLDDPREILETEIAKIAKIAPDDPLDVAV